jgi:hypothetical protein
MTRSRKYAVLARERQALTNERHPLLADFTSPDLQGALRSLPGDCWPVLSRVTSDEPRARRRKT